MSRSREETAPAIAAEVAGASDAFDRIIAFGQAAERVAGLIPAGSVRVEAVSDRTRLRDRIVEHWASSNQSVLAVAGSRTFDTAWAVDEALGTLLSLEAVGVARRSMRVTAGRVEFGLISGFGAIAVTGTAPCTETVIPATVAGMGVVAVAPSAFAGSAVETVLCSAPLRTIGAAAFADCPALACVVLPASVDAIEAGAFENDVSLTHVDVPEGVRTIGPRAFAGCSELAEVILPTGHLSIADDAFVGCHPALRLLVADGSPAQRWAGERGVAVARRRATASRSMLPGSVSTGGVDYHVLPGGMLEAAHIDRNLVEAATLPDEVEGLPVRGIGYDFVPATSRVTELSLPQSLRWVAAHALSPEAPIRRVTGANRIEARGRGDAVREHVRFRGHRARDADFIRLSLRQVCALLDVALPREVDDSVDEPYSSLAMSFFASQAGSLFFGTVDAPEHPAVTTLVPSMVDRLLERGIRAFVADAPVHDSSGKSVPCLVHPDPRRAFETLCAWVARQHDATTIAVTGSVGKTSTKEMVRRVCETTFATLFNEGNQNSVAQVGRYVQELSSRTEVYVQETGAAEPGRIESEARILRADAFIMTNIGVNHVGDYGGRQDLLLADKLSHDRFMPDDGIAFVNVDSPGLQELPLRHREIRYGMSEDADYRAVDIDESDGEVRFTIVEAATGERTPVVVNAIGRHNVGNAVVAFAIGRWLQIPVEKIVEGIAAYEGEGLRQNLDVIGGRRVLVDCYNASEVAIGSTADALQALSVADGGRRIYVVADIDDKLGDITEEVHRRVGEELADREHIDRFYLFGHHAAWIAEELRARGRDVWSTTDRDELTAALRDDLTPEDVVAFKGGQQMALSITIDALFGTSFVLADGDVLEKRGTSVDVGDVVYRIIDEYGAELRKVWPESGLTEVDVVPAVHDTPVYMIGRSACSRTSLQRVRIPEPVRTLARAAFFQARSLVSVELPQSLRNIGPSAFNGCSSLREVIVPDGVTTIGHRAFYRCTGLERLVLPASVRTIDAEAFARCNGLTIESPAGSFAEAHVREQYSAMKIAGV
ncbi:hypothetical protein CIK77_10295 [Microbacterium sp. JB110]|nr:hypothetical protein CIK77_10295 [Microbacterium sp. JB110]